jgi:hypothetical protein
MAQWHCLPSGLQSAIPALANSSGNKDVLTKREMTLPGLLCLAGSCGIPLDPAAPRWVSAALQRNPPRPRLSPVPKPVTQINLRRTADLPVQAPTDYELFLNLKTAKTLGCSLPPTRSSTTCRSRY